MSDPSNEYTTPAAEWAALLALAAEANPARTVADWEWSADLFATDGAGAAFGKLRDTTRPTVLDVPEAHRAEARELLAALGADALDTLRARLGQWATARRFLAAQSETGRQALDIVRTAIARGESPDLAALIQGLQGALDDAMAYNASAGQRATLGTLAASYWDLQAQQRTAVPTGLPVLDTVLSGGFQPQRLVCLLGAPGKGKTTLANQIAEHIADGGRPVLYLTTEDTPATLLHKTVARIGDLDYEHVQRGTRAHADQIRAALAEVAARKSAARLLYLDAYTNMAKLRAVARAHFARHAEGGPGLIVVDYLQRIARADMDGKQELRQAVGKLTDRLRDLARELDCTVLALASQNRAAYNSKNGKGGVAELASAKESGDIEYSCDVMMAIGPDENPSYSPAPGHAAYVLTIAKNRQGPTDRPVRLDWYGARQRFTGMAKGGE